MKKIILIILATLFFIGIIGSVFAQNKAIHQYNGQSTLNSSDLFLLSRGNVYYNVTYANMLSGFNVLYFKQGGNSFGGAATLGTLDNFAQIFKTNNIEAFRITTGQQIGVGITSPTALLHLGASTTARASLRIPAGTAPTSPNAGDIYTTGTRDVNVQGNAILPTAGDLFQFKAGTSTTTAKAGGVIEVNTTTTGNITTGVDTLLLYSLPANTLSTNGDFIEISAFGKMAPNSNNKQVIIKFGDSTIILLNTLSYEYNWQAKSTIISTGAATQKANSIIECGQAQKTSGYGVLGVFQGAANTTATLSSPVNIVVTGEGVSTNDITIEGFIVKWYPNN